MVTNRVMFLLIYTRVNIVTTFVEDKNVDGDDEDDNDGDRTAKDTGSWQAGISNTNKINFTSVGAV
jgi:hypothetical protein